MATINSIYAEIKNMEDAIIAKGGEVIKANSSPSLSEIVTGINSINISPKEIIYNTTAPKVVITAELPNVTINLKDNEGNIVDTKSTGVDGGKVELGAVDSGIYIVEAYDTNNEKIWDNEVEIETDKNTYYVKTGKKFNDYTWSEIKQAADGNYAKYMWRESDRKVLTEWMGCNLSNCPSDTDPSTSRHYVYIMSFDHDIKVSDGTKAGITLATYFSVETGLDNSVTRTITSSYYTDKNSAVNNAALHSLCGQIYQSNINNIGNYWAHVYEAQNNPDTTNAYEWFLDGSVLDKAYLSLPLIPYYANGYRGSKGVITTYTEAKTNERILYWRDWLFNGVPYILSSQDTKLYPDLDVNFNSDNSNYRDVTTYSNSTSYHNHYYYTGWKGNWLTGICRFYTLPKGSEMYMKPKNPITSSTSGTYYLFDYGTKSYQPVQLPAEYDSNKSNMYFEKYVLTDDGPILKCFPQELRQIMEKVRKITVAPYLDSNTNLIEEPLTITTEDYLYFPSAYELYGNVFNNQEPLYKNDVLPTTFDQYCKYETIEGEPFFDGYDSERKFPSSYFLTRTNRYWGYVTKNNEGVITNKNCRYYSENLDQPKLFLYYLTGTGSILGNYVGHAWSYTSNKGSDNITRHHYHPYCLAYYYNGTNNSNSWSYAEQNYNMLSGSGNLVIKVDNFSYKTGSTNQNNYKTITGFNYCFAI